MNVIESITGATQTPHSPVFLLFTAIPSSFVVVPDSRVPQILACSLAPIWSDPRRTNLSNFENSASLSAPLWRARASIWAEEVT